MTSDRSTSSRNRPLLPNWASVAVTLVASLAVASLLWSLAEQNRILRDTAVQRTPTSSRSNTPAIGDRLPAIDLTQVNGATATIPGLVRGGAVVAFLTTTCPFCEASLSPWGTVAASLREAGIPFVAISLDDLGATRTFATRHSITWSLWAASDPHSIRGELRISAVPLTALVSAEAEIMQVWRGQLRSDDVETILRATREAHGS